jgi:hypothetical protein
MIKLIARALSRSRSRRPARRPEPSLSARDWADLPTHHPLVDIDG